MGQEWRFRRVAAGLIVAVAATALAGCLKPVKPGLPDGNVPVAVDDEVTVAENAAPTVVDVLANDTDADTGDVLTITTVDASATEGQVNTDGTTATYDPSGAFDLADGDSATDTFGYTVTDPGGHTSTATVTVTVTGVNGAPVAVDDGATVDEGAAATVVDVLANDTDADTADTLTITTVDTTSTEGLATTDGASVTYDPDGAFDDLGQGDSATDTFDYTIRDSGGQTATATVTVTVTGGALTVALFADDGFTVSALPESPTQYVMEGSVDDSFVAVAENVPAGGVSYRWFVDTPTASDYRVAPVQTNSTVFVRADSIPNFGSTTITVRVVVTPANGTPSATKSARVLYRNSALTATLANVVGAAVIDTHATPNPAPTTATVVVGSTDNAGTGNIVSIEGTVTYSIDTTVLGTAVYGTPFSIAPATLAPGLHTVTATYEVYRVVTDGGYMAVPVFSQDVTLEITP